MQKQDFLTEIIQNLQISAPASIARFFLVKDANITFFDSIKITIGGIILGVTSGYIAKRYELNDGVTYSIIATCSIFGKDFLEYGIRNIPKILNSYLKKNGDSDKSA